tara:strand:- start:315 stop:824 length:510 start_codon:yes stop_codon:yes gene_type:complete
MKTIQIKPKNNYICQNCKNNFISEEIHQITQEFYPVCSKKCEFSIIYKMIVKSAFSDENLKKMLKILSLEEKNGLFNRQEAIFRLTKVYSKIGLSSITYIGTIGQDKKSKDKKAVQGTRDNENPPYVIGGLSPVLSPLLPNPNLVPCPNNQKNKISKKKKKEVSLSEWS